MQSNPSTDVTFLPLYDLHLRDSLRPAPHPAAQREHGHVSNEYLVGVGYSTMFTNDYLGQESRPSKPDGLVLCRKADNEATWRDARHSINSAGGRRTRVGFA